MKYFRYILGLERSQNHHEMFK